MSRNKKILIIMLCLIEVLCIHLTFKSLSNKPVILDDIKFKENKIDRSMFAFYLEQANGTYLESQSNSWPSNGYVLNEEKSGCIDVNGLIIPNALNYSAGTITANVGSTAYCYIYFDIEKPDITVNVTNYNATYNTQTPTCATNDNVYFNTKYQALVFNNTNNKATNCTLTSSNTDLSTTKNTLKDTITGLITSGNIYEHQTGGVTDWVLENVTDSGTNSNGDTVTAGYRYEGKKPNNYIWFNNEMWRIIGVIPTCTASGCTTKEDLVKIIRAESIGGLKWHTSSPNKIWSDQYSLYQVLNSYYLTKGNATGMSICTGTAAADCDYRVKGIDTYYRNMIKDVYWNTGAGLQSETVAVTYGKEILTQNVGGKIGIMNASDYGYATTTHTAALSSYGSYASTNWLYGQGYEWTITPLSSDSVNALRVTHSGVVSSYSAYSAGYAVRPSLYLDSSVYVVSGDGTESTPYQIAM